MTTPPEVSGQKSPAGVGNLQETSRNSAKDLNQFQFMSMHLARVILFFGAILSALEGVTRAMKGDLGRAVLMVVVVAPAMYGVSVALGVVANQASRDQE